MRFETTSRQPPAPGPEVRRAILLSVLIVGTGAFDTEPCRGGEPRAALPPFHQSEDLPEPDRAPFQFGQSLFLTPHPTNSSGVSPLAVDEVFSPPGEVDQVGVNTIDPGNLNTLDLVEPHGETGTERRLHPIQYPLEATLGDTPGEQADELQKQPLRQHPWTPVFLGEGSFLAQAMHRSGLAWSDRQFSFAVIPAGDGELGWMSMNLKATTASHHAEFLRLTPRFAWHSLSGPLMPDLPANLYEADLTTLLYLPVSERWAFLGSVAPGIYSDFRNVNSHAIRIVGRGLTFFTWSQTTKLLLGVTYLDRQDIKVLPTFGVIYAPDPDHKLEAVFPKPRYSVRYFNDGVRERWWYFGADLGGGSWAVERMSGEDDILTYRDYRLLFGWEHRSASSFRWRFEAGYVFRRTIEYASETVTRSAPDSGVIQLGFDF